MRLIYVPTDDARRELQVMQLGRSQKQYIAYIWKMRDKAQGAARKPMAAWPFVRLCHQSNVTKLPARKAKP